MFRGIRFRGTPFNINLVRLAGNCPAALRYRGSAARAAAHWISLVDLIGLTDLIELIGLIDLIDRIDLIGLRGLIDLIDLTDLIEQLPKRTHERTKRL